MQIDVAHKQQHNNPTIQQHNNTTTQQQEQRTQQNNKEQKTTKNKKCCTFKKLHNLTQTIVTYRYECTTIKLHYDSRHVCMSCKTEL
jgi:hypothetical protein